MSDTTRAISALKRNLIPLGLFTLLFPALFLGDGLQPLVDIYISVALSLWSMIITTNHTPERRLPHKFLVPWILVLGFTLLSIPGSLSPGLSISVFIRVLITFVAFFVIYVYSTAKQLPIYLNALLAFVTATAAISFLLPLFPQLALKLPATNLLYAFFGHNHFGALLLVVFPLILDRFRVQKNLMSTVLLTFYLLSFLLTFGRGTILCLFLYLLFSAFKKTSSVSTRRLLLLLAGLLLVFLLGLHFLSTNKNLDPASNTWLTRQIFKSDTAFDSRSRYFAESWVAFKTHPVWGTGPGTFSLSSQKYAQVPNSTSVYVHSFPLEILSETGLVGFLVWSSLLALLFYASFKKPSPLLEGTVLLFLYSFIDFSLNFIIVWLIFWTNLALLSARNYADSSGSKFGSVLFHFSQGLLGVFYISAISSLLLNLSWLTPYNRDSAKTSPPTSITSVLHSHDPDVLFAFYRLRSYPLPPRDRLPELQRIVSLAPYNWTYHSEILNTLTQIGDKQLIADEIVYLSALLNPDEKNLIREINFYRPEIMDQYTPQMVYLAHPENNHNSLYMFYYVLGKKLLNTHPALTRQLWQLAAQIHPWSGLMYAERAALELYTFNDQAKAREILSQCKTVPAATGHCQTILPDLSNLNRPGDLDFLIFKYE